MEKDIFDHHTPNEDQIVAMERIREAARSFVRVIEENTSSCADRSAAIRKVREAMMTANAAVVLLGHC